MTTRHCGRHRDATTRATHRPMTARAISNKINVTDSRQIESVGPAQGRGPRWSTRPPHRRDSRRLRLYVLVFSVLQHFHFFSLK